MTEKKVKEGAKLGRPTKYNDELKRKAVKLAQVGWVNDDIADFLEITRSMFYRYLSENPDFKDALRTAKDESDMIVAKKLFNRAIGTSVVETKKESGTAGEKTTTTTKELPPDVTAQIFWLKNRRPDLWRMNPPDADGDKQATPIKVEIGVVDARKDES